MPSLLSAMQTLEDLFTQSNQQGLLTTDSQTAPEIAAYGVLERLVGNTCVAYGSSHTRVFMHANVPSLQAWHQNAATLPPIQGQTWQIAESICYHW